MNSCCKRGLPVILCLIFLLLAFAAHADSYWKMHWKPGENIISFTPEEDTRSQQLSKKPTRNRKEQISGLERIVKATLKLHITIF